MFAGLPLELWCRIFVLAQEGQSPPEQQRTRLALSPVCRTWHAFADRWGAVAVRGLDQAHVLLDLLQSCDSAGVFIASKIKTVHLDMIEATDHIDRSRLVELVSPFVAVESVSIVLVSSNLRGPRGAGLGDDVCAALATL